MYLVWEWLIFFFYSTEQLCLAHQRDWYNDFTLKCNTSKAMRKYAAGTLEYEDIVYCYRPQCANNGQYITKQCSFLFREWCWCSSPEGYAIPDTFQKNMPDGYCCKLCTINSPGSSAFIAGLQEACMLIIYYWPSPSNWIKKLLDARGVLIMMIGGKSSDMPCTDDKLICCCKILYHIVGNFGDRGFTGEIGIDHQIKTRKLNLIMYYRVCNDGILLCLQQIGNRAMLMERWKRTVKCTPLKISVGFGKLSYS